jgi:hypothetical protein
VGAGLRVRGCTCGCGRGGAGAGAGLRGCGGGGGGAGVWVRVREVVCSCHLARRAHHVMPLATPGTTEGGSGARGSREPGGERGGGSGGRRGRGMGQYRYTMQRSVEVPHVVSTVEVW